MEAKIGSDHMGCYSLVLYTEAPIVFMRVHPKVHGGMKVLTADFPRLLALNSVLMFG